MRYSEDFNDKTKRTVSDHQKAYTKFCVISTSGIKEEGYRNQNSSMLKIKNKSNYVK